MKESFLAPDMRAEDILLGSLGYGEDAKILSIERTTSGYRGLGRFAEGDTFEFENDEALGELERWALELLLKQR